MYRRHALVLVPLLCAAVLISPSTSAAEDLLAVRATLVRPEDPRPQLVLSAHLGRKGDFEGALAAAERRSSSLPTTSRRSCARRRC